ncbi:hypothetical protein ID866_1779 [Astraeus odoratus]|nr:hypothetical protein ID866_1779 [Astraeus odoratus]
MSDIQTRPFSKDYSGLINQSVIAIGLTVICVTSHEVMKRRRRGPHPPKELGSVESWQFGYLYQGRSWARNPAPPVPQGWPLSWVKEVIKTPQARFNDLRGIDAALYVRFLQGCLYYVLLQTFTTVPILLPIHVHFSPDDVATKSMTRASIASLVLTSEGQELLWIHVCLLFWLTLTWVATLFYICNGVFKFRATKIEEAARNAEANVLIEREGQYHPHPHPQFPFQDIPSFEPDRSLRGLRLRTVMVSNVPVELRSNQAMKEYFEYYMSRPIDMLSMGITSSTHPGLVDKFVAFGFNRVKRIPQHIPLPQSIGITRGRTEQAQRAQAGDIPVIERVVIARKMTELASLLERREEVLSALEEAHVKLAKKTLEAVAREIERRRVAVECSNMGGVVTGPSSGQVGDLESQVPATDSTAKVDLLVKTLAPFLKECHVPSKIRSSIRRNVKKTKIAFRRDGNWPSRGSEPDNDIVVLRNISNESQTPENQEKRFKTVWDALFSLPRSVLDPYQPLVHLSVLFRGKTVPAIDYYTAKLQILTRLIAQNRAKAVIDYDPVSTAFITFKDPKDARKACKYLAVHPENPLACLVTMAPQYEDIDWTRIMKSTFRAELIKDWVVSLGVWGFTIFWIFPVSLFVGLVSIQSIASFWPSLYNYLSHHPWQQEIIQSFLPTILVSLLAILIPLILLLIAKKAHRITTLSLIHDTIMIRYYKFLIVNVLVFFCVGVAVLQSFLTSFGNVSESNIVQVVADSFPSAGPFYVGWLIFTTAIHGSLELVMFGLPLFTYPSTSRQITPRKRAVGIRPRTFNFYYWLPNHLLVIHVCLLFALLNPLVVPFGLIYFAVETIRYSLDGLMFSQFVFVAYMAVLKKTVNLALAVVLFILTALLKLYMTRVCRDRFEQDDILEAGIVCDCGGTSQNQENGHVDEHIQPSSSNEKPNGSESRLSSRFRTWRLPRWINFSYTTDPRHLRLPPRRQPIPSRFIHSMERVPSRITLAESKPQADLSGGQHTGHAIVQGPHEGLDNEMSLVQRHPPHPIWDDEPRHDVPYDNPYYNKPITNALWLPRNPLGILDLDDTVDLRRSLTSEPGAGDLGLDVACSPTSAAVSPVYESSARSTDPEHGSMFPDIPKPFSGEEDIDLPEGIRSRVDGMNSKEKITSVDEHRPSLFRQRMSSTSTSPGLRVTRGPINRSRTVDEYATSFKPSSEGRPRAMSMLQSIEDSHQALDPLSDPATRPDQHAQAGLVQLPIPTAPQQRSRVSVIGNVTTGEAVLNEAIAEEQLAAEERLRKEEADGIQRSRQLAPAWLASWFYAKVATRS